MLAEAKIRRPEIQPSVRYFDTKSLGKDVKRWAFFPGDTIVPQRKADIDWLAPGGEETSCPNLQKYGRGFVPRGLASMLELGGDLIPKKHLGDLAASAWSGISLNEEAVKNNLGFIPVYPGDGLASLRAYYMNDQGFRRGLDEVTALVGKEWEECHNLKGTGILDVVELAVYGDGIEPTLRGLTDQIRFAKVNDIRIDFGKFQDDTLRMCGEFKLWAENKLSIEHANLKIGSKADHVYSYSPLAELLLVQLEIPRQDQPLAEMARMHREMMSREVLPAPVQQGLSAADLDLINRNTEALLARAREADAKRIAELEAQVEAQQSAAAAKVYVCDNCPAEFDSPQGKSLHMTRHCKGKPETE